MGVITFRGTTIWDSESTGAGYELRAGSLTPQVIETGAAQGVGYWLKPGNTEPAQHVLSISWRGNKTAIKAAVDALMGLPTGALVTPDYGTISNCVLVGASTWESQRSDETDVYLVSTDLTFRQYP